MYTGSRVIGIRDGDRTEVDGGPAGEQLRAVARYDTMPTRWPLPSVDQRLPDTVPGP